RRAERFLSAPKTVTCGEAACQPSRRDPGDRVGEVAASQPPSTGYNETGGVSLARNAVLHRTQRGRFKKAKLARILRRRQAGTDGQMVPFVAALPGLRVAQPREFLSPKRQRGVDRDP